MLSNLIDYTLPFKPKIKHTDIHNIQFEQRNSLKIMYNVCKKHQQQNRRDTTYNHTNTIKQSQ